MWWRRAGCRRAAPALASSTARSISPSVRPAISRNGALPTAGAPREDYAIAKYAALIAAGFAEDDVRLVIVRDTAIGEDHAIVAARLDGNWIVLDNRRLAMVADAEMQHVVPLFVLDHDGVKQFTPALVAGTPAATPAPVTPAAPAALGF